MAHLSISVLGSIQVWTDSKPVTKLESAKVRALLAFLAVESDRPHQRAALVGLLWPDFPEETARHSLRQALFNLRQALGDQDSSLPYLLITRDTIQFNRESDYSLDLDQFKHYYLSCKENLNNWTDADTSYASRLEEMADLYRGEFLHQLYLDDSAEFEQWVLVQRENLHQWIMEAHTYLANYYELHADYQASRNHASRQLVLDPWREEAHRQLMRVLALDGQRTAALAQYDSCKQVLAKELDVEPSAETRELYEQIRLGTLKPKDGPPADFPSTPVFTLPVQLSPFIGRERELAQLGQLITNNECRCITLVGPGGIGKTRLAVQAAESHFNEFAQGAAFVPLASVSSLTGVIPAIAKAINLTFYGTHDPIGHLLSYLRDKRMLLILDNVEQLLTESPHQENITQLLVEILQSASGVKLLVTTREALNIQEEWLFEVHGLAIPETAQIKGFDEYDAVVLFVQRARRINSDFALNNENRPAVADICRLVEGMPLGIELAATWMRTLSIAEIAREIENSLDFLASNIRDLPVRHRSMRVVFDHSWQMLPVVEQQVLSKLSVFRGGFSRQGAEKVAGASLSTLSLLVNRSLIRRSVTGRYDLHELIRQYCAYQLSGDPQLKSAVQGQHCAFYLALAEAADKELKGPNQLEWLRHLEQEHDNLRIALEWALHDNAVAQLGDDSALKLSASLRWFWRMRGHFHEGLDWLTLALQHSSKERTASRACALLAESLLRNALGNLGEAIAPAKESVAIYKELGDQSGLAEALMIEGLTLLWHGDSNRGRTRTKDALEIYRREGDRWGEAQALYRLGSFMADYGGDPAGCVMLKESAAILEKLGEKYLYTSVLISLGIVEMSLGDYASARPRFERSLAATREIQHPWGIADALTNLGCIYRIQGEYAAAKSLFEEALHVYKEQGRNIWETDVMCAMAENEIAQGDFSAARLHLQAASSLLGSSENKWLQVLVGYFSGLLAYYEGEIDQAADTLENTIRLAREGQFMPDLARSLVSFGLVKIKLGEIRLADQLICDGLDLFHRFGHKLGMAVAMEALANLNLAKGELSQAVMLFSSAYRLREVIGAKLAPVDQAAYDNAIERCRTNLGDATFGDIWGQAAAKSFQDVVGNILTVAADH